MNGVAFCLVGIPPRPEPRPPKVRALIQERGRIQALPGRWQQGWGRGRVPAELGQESQALSCVQEWTSACLSRLVGFLELGSQCGISHEV